MGAAPAAPPAPALPAPASAAAAAEASGGAVEAAALEWRSRAAALLRRGRRPCARVVCRPRAPAVRTRLARDEAPGGPWEDHRPAVDYEAPTKGAPGVDHEEWELTVERAGGGAAVAEALAARVPVHVCKRAASGAVQPRSLTAYRPPKRGEGTGGGGGGGGDNRAPERRAALLLLHDAGESMESVLASAEAAARRGYVACAMDLRSHGARAAMRPSAYREALCAAYRDAGTPREGAAAYALDSVWDATKVLDWLCARPDVDGERVGCLGIGLGGAVAYMLAAVDTRVACCVPVGGVRGYMSALESGDWLAEARTMPHVFALARRYREGRHGQGGEAPNTATEAASALVTSTAGGDAPGLEGVTAGDAKAVWQRVAPGLLEHFDAPACLWVVAPRPLLVVAGECDSQCPVHAVEQAYATAQETYATQGAAPHVRLQVFQGVGHRANEAMRRAANLWLDKYLLHGGKELKALPDIIYALGGALPEPDGKGETTDVEGDVAREQGGDDEASHAVEAETSNAAAEGKSDVGAADPATPPRSPPHVAPGVAPSTPLDSIDDSDSD